MRLFIISNRLPVKVVRTVAGSFDYQRSEGGLATGLGSLEVTLEKHWIGWPGIYLEKEDDRRQVRQHLESMNFHSVFLSKKQIHNYYEGYSNSILWPLCHYFYAFMEYDRLYWETYKDVNQLFADFSSELIRPDDIVWIHDYHLMLLPKMVREKTDARSIGFFLHIPFPSYELFRVLPERAEILNGLLGADLVAFHTHDYMRHFVSAAERVLDLEFDLDRVLMENRMVHVGVFPMGINYELYDNAILDPVIQGKAMALRRNYGDNKLILSVDRLDYSKGILHRLKGFAQFLKNHPDYQGKISLVMVLVPSRDSVGRYLELKTKTDELIGSINGQYSTINWTPIHYFYHSLIFEELTALYYIADIALVTPLRDGMNLVAKEYVATKRDQPGVLILSEMAGSAVELSNAIIINPNNLDAIEWAIFDALEMCQEEQLETMAKMQKIVSRQTVKRWAENFIAELGRIGQKKDENDRKRLIPERLQTIRANYKKAVNRLIILDYDGTLLPFNNKPEEAFPTPPLLGLLSELVDDPKNRVVVSSGRDMNTLESWLGHLPLDMAAEHGAFYKEKGLWNQKNSLISWNDEVMQIFQEFLDKTPQSMLEIKDTALVWHFRKVDPWLASLREPQLLNALMKPCTRLNLQIMRGNKIVEVKSPEYTKGAEAKRLLMGGKYDFILAIGDDTTDEDTFAALPHSAYTIKIGGPSHLAGYYLISQSETLPLIRSLIADSRTDKMG
jgi:trehalose 6-phosphate synthase/phosphatase